MHEVHQVHKYFLKLRSFWLGLEVHVYDPTLGSLSQEALELKASLGYSKVLFQKTEASGLSVCAHALSFLPLSLRRARAKASESPGEIQSLPGANTVSWEGQTELGRGRCRRSRPYPLPVCLKDKAI